jgi:hypothetical protein
MELNETTYVQLNEVKEFIAWTKSLADDHTPNDFIHSYKIESKVKSNNKRKCSCCNLYQAFQQYERKFSYSDYYKNKIISGSIYDESETSLNYLRSLLLEATTNKDNDACMKACSMILKWGGVLGGDKRGNKKTLSEMKDYLAVYLQKAQEYFNHKSTLSNSYKINVNGEEKALIMNSGFTKIYSLLCDEFIIYDGRVGAALGLLVRKFLESNSPTSIPESLSFYYGKARNPKVNRNPSSQQLAFKSLSSSSPVHIRNNLKANWIIKNLNLDSVSGFSDQPNPSLAFESALFMIGYRM